MIKYSLFHVKAALGLVVLDNDPGLEVRYER